ncbi:MAG: endonuclease III [Candidatus Hinthialibacteria bacterium]
MTPDDFPKVFQILRAHRDRVGQASVTEISRSHKRDPYRVLISCLISLRTKDEVTAEASKRLFHLADTPGRMLRVPQATIAETIFPAGFYRNKAATILEVSQTIIDKFHGNVPDNIEELLTLKGVGRKTANLVVTLGFGKPGICVDTHVHRITNRWGILAASTPDKTEQKLREILPKRYWIPINDLLVTYGRTLCKPISPLCSQCRISPFCLRVGVVHSR